MSLLSQVIVDHLKHSLSCERFLGLQLYCCCNVLQFKQKIKFYESLCSVSQVFFSHESQPAGPVTKTKKGQCRVEKSKTTLALGIRSPSIKELDRNGGIVVDFNGVWKTLFNY